MGMCDKRALISITQNGKTTELTGWRAWLVGAGVATILLLVALFVLLLLWGIALSMTVFLFVVVPAAILYAIVSDLFRPGGSSRTKRNED